MAGRTSTRYTIAATIPGSQRNPANGTPNRANGVMENSTSAARPVMPAHAGLVSFPAATKFADGRNSASTNAHPASTHIAVYRAVMNSHPKPTREGYSRRPGFPGFRGQHRAPE